MDLATSWWDERWCPWDGQHVGPLLLHAFARSSLSSSTLSLLPRRKKKKKEAEFLVSFLIDFFSIRSEAGTRPREVGARGIHQKSTY